MIGLGLGVGIDYSLVLLNRFRTPAREGLSVPDASNAWIAALKPELVERLIADTVDTFAFSAAAVEISSDPARAAVVEALVDAAARDDQQPGWNLDLTRPVHSTLGGRLSRRLQTESADSQPLWWLSRLAIAGRWEGIARRFVEESGCGEDRPVAFDRAAGAGGCKSVGAPWWVGAGHGGPVDGGRGDPVVWEVDRVAGDGGRFDRFVDPMPTDPVPGVGSLTDATAWW